MAIIAALALAPWLLARSDATRLAVGSEEPPRNLDARGFSLLFADQTAGAIALDLIELIAVDGGVEGFGRAIGRPRTGKRPQQDDEHDHRETGKNDPKQHGGRRPPKVDRGLGIGKGVRRGKVRQER